MKYILFIAVLLFSFGSVQAKQPSDTAFLHKGILEQTSLYKRWMPELDARPEVKMYLRTYKLSSLFANYRNREEDIPYRTQDGAKEKSWEISSESFLPLPKRKFLWGDATYERTFISDVTFRSTADYDLLYPQIIADIYKNNSRMERYEFGGGYGMAFKRWAWGVEGHFRALHEYRKQDPRAKNIVADLDVTLGASYHISDRYSVFLDGSFRKYKQNSSVKSFATTVKREQLMMMGPATHYFRYGGVEPNALYKGKTYGVSGGVFSRDMKGFDFYLHYHNFKVERTISELYLIPLTELEEHNSKAIVSWKNCLGRHKVGVRASGEYTHHTGRENVLGEPIGNLFKIVAKFDQYYSEEYKLDGKLLYGYTAPRWISMELALFGGLRKWDEHCLLPVQKQRIDYYHLGGNLNVQKTFGKKHLIVLNVNADYIKNTDNDLKLQTGKMVFEELKKDSKMGKIVYGNHKQQTTDYMYVSTDLLYSYVLNDELSFFISGEYNTRMFKKKVSNHLYSINVGIFF